MSTPPPRIVVLISGSGTNLQALIDAQNTPPTPYKISLVLSNKPNVYGLTRAQTANIPTLTIPLKPYLASHPTHTRTDFDSHLASQIHSHLSLDPLYNNSPTPDLIVLAGFMHILSPKFLQSFPDGRIINLHPALPGAFDGAHAIERAFQAYKEGKITETGVMIHKVIPEVDRGEVVLKREVPIEESDTLESLEEKIHTVEHQLIVEGTKRMLETK
ncbi:hypothetical protein HDV00_005830 [Rhizophlyctis rosea]|nr:hypothetical protein HDV00_005830 [Rhizophlyctis rosea]